MLKRIRPVLLILALVLLVSCSPADNKEKTKVNIATLKGPTGMGMIKLIEDNSQDLTLNKYNFTLVGAPDEITGKLVSGEIDIAALPVNLAANLYNKTDGKLQLLALNTLGVLYILENGESINSINDLDGKTIYATGQGSTPEYILDYIIKENDLNVTVEYKSEHAELASLALAGEADIVMLPEPFVTTVLSKNADFRIALDITEEFERVGDGTVLSMGVIVVNAEFAKNNKKAVEDFLKEYGESAKFVNENIEDAAKLIAKHEIVASEEIAKSAIPNCNIVLIQGSEMKDKVAGLYQLLFEYNPNSIGGIIPGDDFYYETK